MDGGAALRRGIVIDERRLAVRCPGKVNLHLEVLGKRPDGYHELRTVFAAVGLWDELELREAPPGVVELSVEPRGAAPVGEDNLVVRAARALIAAGAAGGGARITLRKRIPVAGGLGGGSSDAAGALVGLAALWGLDRSFAALQPIAASLGADVPFFLVGGAALGTGRGADVEPLPDLPALWVVLLPGRKVSTAAIYATLAAGEVREWEDPGIRSWQAGVNPFPFARCRNDLQPVVVASFPWVAERLRLLDGTGAVLRMVAGSGATVFGLYESRAVADDVAAELVSCGALVVPLLSRAASREPRSV